MFTTSPYNLVHFVRTPFSGVGLYGGFRGNEWYRERIQIFKNYTLKSLKAQTNQNFLLWLTFRPQEEYNPLTAELLNYLKDEGIQYVTSFEGLLYHDDKFGGGLKQKLTNAGRILRGAYRNNTWGDVPANLKEIWQDKNATLPQRLQRVLSKLRPYFEEATDILVTHLDSDDMLAKNAIQQIQETEWKYEVMTIPMGYIYNVDTDEIAEWRPKTSPPFHTIRFSALIFFSPTAHLNRIEAYRSHEDAHKLGQTMMLGTTSYCVTVHGKSHISTTWSHPFKGAPVDPSILKDFGL